MIRFVNNMGFVSLVLLAMVQPVGAQSAESSVSGMGVATIERPAERMRMQIELTATAPTLKEALKALKDRRDAAEAQLEALGAEKASVKFSDVAMSEDSGSDRRKEMERMLRNRLSSRKGKDGKAGVALPTSHTVAVQLMADWPLKSASPEETLLAVYDIQGQVRKADLAGQSEKKALTPEEQELEEEMSEMRNFGDEEERPGEPNFIFVAQLSDAEREKALADAFAKAKAQAARTAKAAGAELGALVRVADPSAGIDPSDMMSGYYGEDAYAYSRYASQARRQAFFTRGISENESFAPQPGKVSIRVGINAVFRLK
jgi:uncharacterized protein YggE